MTDAPDDLLPQNATEFERAQSKTSARILDTDTNIIRRARVPAQTPAAFLPFLAAERSVHHYGGPFTDEFTAEFPGSIAFKRAQTASSFSDHLSYGTPAALEKEIELDAGFPVRIVEFFEDPELTFPDFMVEATIDPGEPYPDMAAARRSAANRKNVREVLAKTRVRVRQPIAAMNVGAATHATSRVRIFPIGGAPPPKQVFVGAFTRAMPKVRIFPLRVGL